MEISPMPSSAFQFTPTPNTGLPFSSGEGATHSLECHKATDSMCPRHRDSAHSPRKGGTQGLQNKDAICTANRNIPWSQNQQRSAHAAHPPPTRPFEHVMMDFIELHPAEGKKFCLVFVDMWSKWVEAIPTSKAARARALITEIIPRWGIPEKISSDNGTHFVNEALTQISVYLGINLKRHCAYHPQSGGAVDRENGSLKAKMAKCCEDMGLPWTEVLPLALMYMRMCKRGRANLSPFEILFAGIPNVGANAPRTMLPDTTLCENSVLTYCRNLSKSLSDIRGQVKAALPTPAEEQLHNLKSGDYVVKDFRRTRWNQKRWQGPFQILLVTQTAVKVAERVTWIHASHCKRVPEPKEPVSRE
ncbi:uncharacterized protein isoform X1 [Takifugu rubripes]|uniref:uncharacterized protein isoform X1 n=2 Tax=Takifugu rubripes TaxID=31033 RepID=UPI001145F75C|nr:uncharacterized protein LOC115251489 isoform X1 [Takifugu rubripes]XP_029699759.1 uncharacterized protein LOC115251489 isoform X1 [Takifugu rubripes]XP_029699760.1 uncharacterized protein LOC115251489 isoform X1 [Takifugu rubripes]XP_029699762.1 uncharacterized protein LOC115251489 isoform X1 [Takifugu rubripes]XP_029699763.1 uncharacterized protein LOC115251489 isoform X1 [Takifugu rubripes]